MRKITRKSHLRRRFIALAILLLLFGGGYIVYKRNADRQPATSVSDTQEGPKIDLSPPTEADKQQVEEHKDDLAQQQEQSNQNTNSSQKTVTPVITSVSRDRVSGYIPGVVEDGGTCTITLVKGSETVTKTSAGFINASYTSCTPFSVSLASGKWKVTLEYSSQKAKGSTTQEWTVE